MSNYVLIKDYNPAYRPWIRAALRQKKFMGDRDYSAKELERMSIDMGRGGVKDELFQGYYWAFSRHKEYQPDYLSILHLAMPAVYVDGKLNQETISQLDIEARTRGERILMTVEDAAQDFYDFYENILTKPLAHELERDETRRKLIAYFEYEEIKRVPDMRTHTEEEVETGARAIAIALLQWLRTVTRKRILDDIEQTLDKHCGKAQERAKTEQAYLHKSEYVELLANRSGHDGPVTTVMTPARGHGAVKKGYADVLFPTYWVLIRNP